MKKLLKVVVVLVVLVVILAVAVVFSIDGIAKSAVEKGSNYALGVETTLDGADVGLTSGTFAMNGLTVRNPEGYATPHFLALGTGATEVSLGTLREDVVRIPRLELATIDINLENRDGKGELRRHPRQPEALRIRRPPNRRNPPKIRHDVRDRRHRYP